jgi:hypothetical protein
VTLGESDLFIKAENDLADVSLEILSRLRLEIESYVKIDKKFLVSLAPVVVPDWAPQIIKKMVEGSSKVDVGPMASIAGAISEALARALNAFSKEVIVENGGDIFIINKRKVGIAIYAGDSKLSMKLGVEVDPHPTGISVCTSSGKVGHSLSFGNADAVTVVAESGIFADAAATAICNTVKTKDNIDRALNFARQYQEILGLVIIIDEKIAVLGETIKLCSIEPYAS